MYWSIVSTVVLNARSLLEQAISWEQDVSDAILWISRICLDSCQILLMKRFFKNSPPFSTPKCFPKKDHSKMFDKVLNLPLQVSCVSNPSNSVTWCCKCCSNAFMFLLLTKYDAILANNYLLLKETFFVTTLFKFT